MATPTTTIDALPAKTTPVGTELLIIQDIGVTKKMTLSNMLSQPTVPLTTHINDTTAAHMASSIGATDSGGGINGATVQAQLGQLSTLVAALEARIAALEAA